MSRGIDCHEATCGTIGNCGGEHEAGVARPQCVLYDSGNHRQVEKHGGPYISLAGDQRGWERVNSRVVDEER